MKFFIEFWKAKATWHQLPIEKRVAYVTQMQPVMEELALKDVVMDAWGENTDTTMYKADFDFYAITKFPKQEVLESFQTVLEKAEWYTYFEQVNMSGTNLGMEAVIEKMINL